MLHVGITGQAGFMGTHLFNYLSLDKDHFTMHSFKDEYFQDENILKDWVQKCDVIVHLAAMNRHNDPNEIYKTNLKLVKSLIKALEDTSSTPHLLFSSSTQEERDNPYGRSKKEGRELLVKWAKKSGATFSGLVIPNVFGPFGNPYYNSVVATFSHQLNHNETPKIDVDGDLKMIYVGELVKVFCDCILEQKEDDAIMVQPTGFIKVSIPLSLLLQYKKDYAENGMIPDLPDAFHRNLFNTFKSYMDIPEHYPFALTKHSDDRGSFVETMRLGLGGQVSFSTTRPGITRGNHFHTRKIERFVVVKGEAKIQLRKIGSEELIEFKVSGDAPAFVDMPVWYTHNITNIGDEELYTLFWINEFYDPNDPDTYFEEV